MLFCRKDLSYPEKHTEVFSRAGCAKIPLTFEPAKCDSHIEAGKECPGSHVPKTPGCIGASARLKASGTVTGPCEGSGNPIVAATNESYIGFSQSMFACDF
jgi:hypothetical protein